MDSLVLQRNQQDHQTRLDQLALVQMPLVVLYPGLELDRKATEWVLTLLTSLPMLIQPRARLMPSVQSDRLTLRVDKG